MSPHSGPRQLGLYPDDSSTALRLWRTWHGRADFLGVGFQGLLDELSDHVIICGSEDAFVNFAEQVRVQLNACV